jgi:hypothetical protein
VRPADWNRMGVFGSAFNATGPRSRLRGSSLDVRVPAHGPLRGAWPAGDGGPPPNGADPSRDQREPSGSARTSATVDRPTARSSGTLILSSPSMALLHERTPSGQSERGSVGEGLWCGNGMGGHRRRNHASSGNGLLDRSRQRLNSSGQSAFPEGFYLRPDVSIWARQARKRG